MRSGNTEIRGNNLVQVQNEIFSLPMTNPGAEFGDLTGWSAFDFDAVNSPGDAYSGEYYFGFYEPQSSFLLEPLSSQFHSFGEFTSETIDLSSLGQIQDIHVTAFTWDSDIYVSVEDLETGEVQDYLEDKIFWISFYDIEDNFLSGVGFGGGGNEIGWEQRLESFRSFWSDEEWNAFEPLIDHMTIGFETMFYADSEDDSFDQERYQIISYSWVGADGNNYSGDMADYFGEQLPIVGFDDIELEVDVSENLYNCTSTYTLPSDQWRQISIPCNPGEDNSVEVIFGDDNLGTIGTDWRIFHFNTANNTYNELLLTDSINPDEGYWIIQSSGDLKTLSMPADSIPVETSNPSGCNNDEGCFNIPLATQDSGTQWNMIGYPFEQSGLLANMVVTGEQSCNPIETICNLDAANTNGIVQNAFWTYEGEGYTKITTSDSLNPWKGYWVATLENAEASAPINLVIPQ